MKRRRDRKDVLSVPSILATGGDTFFLVATIGDAAADVPKVLINGETVRVGEQTVRFDGEKILFGEPPPQ